jgi:hypothetical protein
VRKKAMGAKPMAFSILRAMDRIHGPFFYAKKREDTMRNRKETREAGRKQ